MSVISAKKAAIIFAIVIIGLVAIVAILHNLPEPGSSTSPVVENEKDERKEESDAARGAKKKSDLSTKEESAQAAQAEKHSIGGRVIENGTRKPIPEISVFLNQKEESIDEAQTDDKGSFRFSDLAPSQYEVSIGTDDPEISEKYSISSDGNKIRVYLKKMDIENLTFSLTPAMHIKGKVVDEDDNPIEGAELRFSRSSYSQPLKTTFSDTDGMFELSGLGPGAELGVLRCELSGYQTIFLKGLYPPVDNLVIELLKTAHATISGKY